MSATALCVAGRLPKCLAALVINYFGRSTNTPEMATFGQYEDCIRTIHLSRDLPKVFENACAYNWPHIVDYLISTGMQLNYKSGMACASRGGHFDIINIMIAHGANNWDFSMIHACYYGQFEVVEFMIAKGATNWNSGLSGACVSGSKK